MSKADWQDELHRPSLRQALDKKELPAEKRAFVEFIIGWRKAFPQNPPAYTLVDGEPKLNKAASMMLMAFNMQGPYIIQPAALPDGLHTAGNIETIAMAIERRNARAAASPAIPA